MATSGQANAVENPPVPCIARQPILTASEDVCGYELFFRESHQDRRANFDLESATCTTIDSLILIGLDVLCDGHPAFINCTHDMLLKDYFGLLPPHQIVVEVQENVPADQDVLDACQRLRGLGYRIALDNFVVNDSRLPLLPHANFIKVDFQKLSPNERTAVVARRGKAQCHLLAQKVETRQDFVTARKEGFDHFQGYFFRRPQTLRSRQIPAHQSTCLTLLKAVSKPELDLSEVEDLIRREPSLCYRLLRYLNSPVLGLVSEVQSIRQALSLLGDREVTRWIRMATTLVMGQGKPSDLVLSSLVRARFCELLGSKVQHGDSDLFLMGMLSLMDAILEAPIGIITDGLALDPVTKAQLVAGKSGAKTPLSPIYELMVARESGDWEAVTALGKRLNLSLYFLAETYNESLRWAHAATKTEP